MRITNFQWLSIVTWLVRYAIAEPGYAEISMWHGKDCYNDDSGIGMLAVDTALNGCYKMPYEAFSFSMTEKATSWATAYVDFCYSGCDPAKCESIVPRDMAADYCYRPKDSKGRGYYTVRNRFTKRENGAGPDPIDSEQALNETTGIGSEPSQLERRSGRMTRVRALGAAPHALLIHPERIFEMIPLIVGGDTYRIISSDYITSYREYGLSLTVLKLARTALRLGDYIQDLNPHASRYGAGLTINVSYKITRAVFGAINPFHETLVPALFTEVINAITAYNGDRPGPRVVEMTLKVLHARTGAEQEWRIAEF